MKKTILLFIFASLLAFPSFAQKHSSPDKEGRQKEFMEFKLKFLAEEIDLKEDQKKEFNEVYTQMETERRSIYKKIKAAEKKISDNKNASEADYEKAATDISNAKAEMTQIEKKYDEKFSTFLTKKQMYKLKEAECKFMERMRECREKKKNEKKDRK